MGMYQEGRHQILQVVKEYYKVAEVTGYCHWAILVAGDLVINGQQEVANKHHRNRPIRQRCYVSRHF